jgi:hypothetical protein
LWEKAIYARNVEKYAEGPMVRPAPKGKKAKART